MKNNSTLCFPRSHTGLCPTILDSYFLCQRAVCRAAKSIGIKETARHVLSQLDSDIVYYEERLNGDLIFLVRKFDLGNRPGGGGKQVVVVTNIEYCRQRVSIRVDFFSPHRRDERSRD